MKNPVPVFLIIAMLAVLCYSFYMAGLIQLPQDAQAGGPAQSQNGAAGPTGYCKDGQTQYCRLGNCSGESVCMGGAWGGCRWDRTCTPGTKATCLKNNCPYGLKECNECGTGYGPCSGLDAS